MQYTDSVDSSSYKLSGAIMIMIAEGANIMKEKFRDLYNYIIII